MTQGQRKEYDPFQRRQLVGWLMPLVTIVNMIVLVYHQGLGVLYYYRFAAHTVVTLFGHRLS